MSFHNLHYGSLSLLTDLYELTMAQGYWKLGMAEYEACFHLFFRKHPFHGNFAIAAGLETAMQYMDAFRFEESDLKYLSSLRGSDGAPLFEKEFLKYLSMVKLDLDVAAVPEGTPLFPHEPMVRVSGPIIAAQLLEGPLLNILNFQTLIATKASRIVRAADGDEVIEFGLRRAQGMDGALSGSRAAYIGGCHSTSNTLAGKLFSIPVRGTHAHSWILAFENERESFEKYASVSPGNCMFLIDTYDTATGAQNAAEVAKEMREKGHEMVGVRIDSGDLAQLSIEVRQILDHAGFTNAKIMASNELDEFIIRDLKQQGAKITTWGVGTNLITGKDQPALDGVYKLTALKKPGGQWIPKVKCSEQTIKTNFPGFLQVRRFMVDDEYAFDVIYDEVKGFGLCEAVSVADAAKKRVFQEDKGEDLLIPIYRKGVKVYHSPSIHAMREKAANELKKFHLRYQRFLNPHTYFVGVEKGVHLLKLNLAEEISGVKDGRAKH